MEVDLVEHDLSEDDNYSIDEYNEDDLNFEGERCGICMDVVIDRGVLDCCQHWFCFTCIDNWATITNLCPLCQNEFQIITCVPVYDTISSTKTDEDTHPSDDSWSVDGRNSFPSYYIDENVVVCLGDDCTIRNGLAAVGEDSNLDTSIACDLCDKWYHAYCVEFDTESSCEESWLCPRCLVLKAAEKSDMISRSGPSKELSHDAGGQCVVGSDLVGKVLVSVADVGETALVVSMVEGDKMNEESVGNPSSIDLYADIVVDTVLSDPTTNLSRLGSLPCSGSIVEPNLVSEGLGLSLLQNTFVPSTSSLNPIESTHLMTHIDEKTTGELRLLDGQQTRSRELFAESSNDTLLEAGLDLHLALSSNPSSAAQTPATQPAVDLTINETEIFSDPVQLQNATKKHLLPVDMVMEDTKEIISAPKMSSDIRENGADSVKRKNSDNSVINTLSAISILIVLAQLKKVFMDLEEHLG
ncbi:hypothetical protein LIER_29354 [Lithospermum erythrorhizon]|uniref:RING-type domain-containing protein n=1 Tax=Lithospermum erythrorhizon TaxID=34254 RepID=A0AAV3RMF9_LITER